MAQFHNSRSFDPMTYQRLIADLSQLGIRRGGVLLVHSSLRSLGLPAGDPSRAEMVVAALLEVLGSEGTLLMPALSYESVNARQPVFDVAATPSCVGAITEYFRTRPQTGRSIHPTHSVCGAGKQAAELLGSHSADTTPCGPNSPFAKLPQVSGQVLFLGCGLLPNTSMHAIEEHVEPEYLFRDFVDYRIHLEDGSLTSMRVRRHNFHGWAQRYDRLESLLSEGISKGPVLKAEAFLIESKRMWPAALQALRQNPLFFVERTQ